ncbi:hypothetical protein BSK48_17095 [Paenibacillus odorifer]|uniref:right-handed parallel beta-helix repeat-containing protein n=1 Tax=Paenibacillus odorifer TaxID=189426 RepID=UPI00096EA9F1|nr:right-handed parallel beta-helix repeat-containing protein [Paenibacillus odorifer]OMD69192.1 hypothetical protein BSK48_17095 [Paenibacillus odorifer]
MPNVPMTNVNAYYSNTSPGNTILSNVIDAAIQDIVQTTNDNWAIYDAFVTSMTLPIPDQSIVERHIRNLAITNPKLAPSAVTNDKIADGTITAAKLADLLITTSKLADLSVTNGKLVALAVTGDKIANSTITTDKLQDLLITTAKLAPQSVTEPKLGTNSVSTRALAPQSVTASKLDPSLVAPISDAGIQYQFGLVNEQLADIVLNVKSFGAVADGVTNDNPAIDQAIQTLKSLGGGTILFPYSPLPYIVKRIKVYDASNIVFTAPMGTTIKIKDGSDYGGDDVAEVFDLLRSNNITIENLTLDGNRNNLNYNVPGYTGDGTAHGIVLESCDRIFIRNVSSRNNGTDGIATRFFVSNVYIDKSVFTNSRRNNMSVTRETDGLYVTNTEFSNANGTAPQDGVDIEPTGGGRLLQNILFDNCLFKDNLNSGLSCDIRGTNKLKNVTVSKCKFVGNGQSSIAIPLRDSATSESINIIDCLLDGYISFSNPLNAAVTHTNISIIGCYTTSYIALSSVYGALIEKNTIDRPSGGEEILIDKDSNNIIISKNTLKSRTTAGIRRSVEGATAKNISILDNQIYNKTSLRAIMLIGTLNGIDGVIIKGNHLYNNSETALQLMNVMNGRVSDNLIHDNASGLRMENCTNISVDINNFYNQSTSNIHASTTWTGNSVRNNSGIVTEASGITTILSGTTFIAVTVANSIALRIQDLTVTPSTSLGTATKFWVSNVGTNGFRINVDSAASGNIEFSWRYARL